MTGRLTNLSVIREIQNKYGFRFKKGLGQNFLNDAKVIEDIIEGSGINKETSVIEIGPGFGALTQGLIESAGDVTSIEIDESLIGVLNDIFSDADNFTLINSDVLKLNLNDYIKNENTVIAANLPYYVTTPVISYLLENRFPLKSVTVMVQKEVAKRMVAAPGSEDYGAFTCLVNYYSDPEIIRYVKAGCFTPMPKVDSAVIIMRIPETPKYTPKDEEKYKKVVKAVFQKRRKTLLNGLSTSGYFEKSKEEITEALHSIGIDPSVRGENLSIDEFIKISEIL